MTFSEKVYNIILITLFLILIFCSFLIGRYTGFIVQREEITNKEMQVKEELIKQIELLLTVQSIVMCESSGKHEQWGDHNKKYPAFGIGQFQERTFYWLAGKAGFKNLNWKKVDDQLNVLIWAVDNGFGNLWTCYRKVAKP